MAGPASCFLCAMLSFVMLRPCSPQRGKLEPAARAATATALQYHFAPLLQAINITAGIPVGWADYSQNPCSPPEWNFSVCQGQKLVGISFRDSLSFTGIALPPLPASFPQLDSFTQVTISRCNIQGSLPGSWSQLLPALEELDISNNLPLSGGLPEAWGDFTELKHLNLSGSSLSGTLPESWGALSKLESLDLSFNSFSGAVPASWSKLNLTYLDLSNNRLSGQMQTFGADGVWSSLTYLNASYNQFSGPLPEWEGSALRKLDLESNMMTGSMPVAWTSIDFALLAMKDNQLHGTLPPLSEESWSEMSWLDLAGNGFSGPIDPQLPRLPVLSRLYLHSNAFSGRLPDWPANPPVQLIHFGSNNLTGSLPDSWGSLSELQALSLASNRLIGTVPASWQQLNVSIMFLNDNGLSGSLPEQLVQGWASDASLDISSNAFSGTISAAMLHCSLDASLNQLTGTLPNVTLSSGASLNVSFNFLTGSVPSMILSGDYFHYDPSLDASHNSLEGRLPDIRVAFLGIYLQNNCLTGSIPVGWSAASDLDLSSNSLTGLLPDPFPNFHSPNGNLPWASMYSLNLSHNHLSGQFLAAAPPEDVAYLSRPGGGVNPPFGFLQVIDLSSNQLTGQLTDANMSSLVSLAYLDLSHNAMTGPLPFTAGSGRSLPGSLKVLNLHNNSFQGELNPAWGSTATNLTQLDLGRNFLTGNLPDQWAAGTWTSIETIVLIDNHLNGTLPDSWGSIGSWQSISSLHLNNNNFTGTIPASWILNPAAFTALQLLDLSTNDLRGSLPQDGWQYGKFRAQMALKPGNDKLCGPIPRDFSKVTDEYLNILPDGTFHACPNNDLSAGGIAGIVIAGALLVSSVAALFLYGARRKQTYDREIQNYQRMLEQNELLAEEIDRWMESGGQTSISMADQPALAYNWHILPSRLQICRDAKERPVRLGKGATGVVYKAVLDGSTAVACKVLFKETAKHTADNLKHFAAEVDTMMQCCHPNIVALIGAWVTLDMAFIVSELCDGGSLYAALVRENFADENSRFLWSQRGKAIALDLAGAISFLSSQGIIHFDVKSSNVVLTGDYQAKLCDVGLAHRLEDETRVQLSRVRGTDDYVPPEVLLDLTGSLKADIFCYGWLLWEICTGERVIRGQNRSVRVPEECPAQIALLIDWCTRTSPHERPTAEEVMFIVQTANATPLKHPL